MPKKIKRLKNISIMPVRPKSKKLMTEIIKALNKKPPKKGGMLRGGLLRAGGANRGYNYSGL